jgi:hypothetical protein
VAAEWLLPARSALVPVLFYTPLAAAMVIGVSTSGPFGELERTASRSLPALRLGHLCGLLILGLAALEPLAIGREQAGVELTLARNLGGFTGMALLTTRVTGSRLSWTAPFAYAVLALLIGAAGPNKSAVWVWPLQPATDDLSMTIAFGLLAAGLAIAALFGAREGQGVDE